MDSNFIEVDVRNSAKDKLLENTENLERSSRKLDHGHELLHESESVGAGVLADLAHQKEVISRARNRVRIFREIDNLTKKLHSLISRNFFSVTRYR